MIGRRNALQKAADDIAQAAEAASRWSTEADALRTELESLESRAGAEVLDDESRAAALTAQIGELRVRADLADRTALAARERLVEAQRAAVRARAAELREQAARLRAEAEERQAKTDRLLAELSEWEGGARYVLWRPDPVASASAGAGLSYKVPTTEVIRERANALDRQAATLERQADAPADKVAASAARVLAADAA